jgi:hypothetical protein
MVSGRSYQAVRWQLPVRIQGHARGPSCCGFRRVMSPIPGPWSEYQKFPSINERFEPHWHAWRFGLSRYVVESVVNQIHDSGACML